jgi:hypothetical protein
LKYHPDDVVGWLMLVSDLLHVVTLLGERSEHHEHPGHPLGGVERH